MPKEKKLKPISQPLVKSIYTADPSAHAFDGKIYIYPSHDIDAGIPQDDYGGHFAMEDYRILSMKSPSDKKATVHPVALHVKNVPWADKQFWAPDAAFKDGTYFLYFPAKAKDGAFYIGVATSKKPAGPFKPQPKPIKGSFSIDPAVFVDDDGHAYMYFGGIWGGQLQRWQTGKFIKKVKSPFDLEPADDQPAIAPKVARLTDNMLEFSEKPRDLLILDPAGTPLLAGDHNRRFFEASWMHKHNGTYYYSYSTGDTHFICYATAKTPYGPFTYKGVILNPVIGWTNHHSIMQFKNKWFLFYHDSSLSKGITHLRSVKVTPLKHNPDGTIQTITAYK